MVDFLSRDERELRGTVVRSVPIRYKTFLGLLTRRELQLACDLDAALYRSRYRTTVRINPEHPFDGIAVFFGGCKVEGLGDAFDDEDFVLRLDLTDGIGVEALERNLTRSQRAGKGAEQSAAGGGDHVVEGRGVGFLGVRGDAVVLRDLAVDAEEDRLVSSGDVGAPDLALDRLYPHLRDVLYFGHFVAPLLRWRCAR